MDSTIVKDAAEGLNLLWTAVSAVIGLIGFVAGKIAGRKKKG
jgi:hypothetical protein